MTEYPKIQSIFKRDEKTHIFIEGMWSTPEFGYLENNRWVFTEKVDGTNIRIYWSCLEGRVYYKGRTDNAQISTFLLTELQNLFPIEKFQSLYPTISMCLYGEGFGAKIQKGGGNYLPDSVGFVLFDVLIDRWWLERPNMLDIADKLEINTVPVRDAGTLHDAITMVKSGLISSWGNFQAEGLVCKPYVELFTRKGDRVITKLKHRDFKHT